MNLPVRRTAIVVLVAIVVVGAAAAWYVLSETRRTGRLVGQLLSSQLGVAVNVDAAVVTGSRVRLRGVTVSPQAGAPIVVRADRVDVEGGMLALVAPSGRRMSIEAVAPSVTLPAPAGPGGAAFEAVPHVLQAILDWPGDLRLSIQDANVQAGRQAYRVSTTADKTGGVATAVVQLGPVQQSEALTADLRSEAVGPGAMRLHARLRGDPSRLPGLWPAALTTPVMLTARVDSRFAPGEPVTAAGQATIGTTNVAPVVVDFTLAYDPRQTRLTISRYSAVRAPDVRLHGNADIGPSGAGLRVALSTGGEIEGSPLNGYGAWETGTGRFEGEVTFTALDIDRIARRLGGSAPASARGVVARFSGITDGPRPVATVQARAQQISVAALPGAVLKATLDAQLGLATGANVVGVARVDQATLRLLRDDRTLAVLTAASPPSGLWPVALQAKADDLSLLGSAGAAITRLSGQGRFAGEARQGERLAVDGAVEATVPQAELSLGSPVLMSDLRANVPVLFGTRPSSGGTLALARVVGRGVTVTDVAAATEMVDGRLLLSELRYAHAHGRGSGWVEVVAAAGGPRVQARLDAAGVDLATLLSETGLQLGRLTGRLRYTLTVRYPGSGPVALLRASSEEGGEVSIDAVQRLLESAAVQAETSGLLQQTLENLRVFPYESLTAEVRISLQEARLDLSLVGRKRLGIFPAPVEAINLRNVPLSLLVRTFARENP
jgi:hypothetical protein